MDILVRRAIKIKTTGRNGKPLESELPEIVVCTPVENPDPPKAIAKRAIELRNRGLKIPEIANALNLSERSVFRYLTGNIANGGQS